MAKNDLKQIKDVMKNTFEENNKILLKKIQNMIGDSEANIIGSVDKTKADKSYIEELDVRVKKLERSVFP